MCLIPNGFRDRAISLYSSKLLIRKIYAYYVLFLIPVFILHVTKVGTVYLVGIYSSRDKSWYSLSSKLHNRTFHRQHQYTLQMV
jgi:hypothetical protein